jgi:hypothetical protein
MPARWRGEYLGPLLFVEPELLSNVLAIGPEFIWRVERFG